MKLILIACAVLLVAVVKISLNILFHFYWIFLINFQFVNGLPTEEDEDLEFYFDLIDEQLADALVNNQKIDCILVCGIFCCCYKN